MNAHHILQAMRAGGGQELLLRDEPARAEVYGEFARIEEAERQAAASVTMLDLVSRTQARPELVAPAAESEKQIPLTAYIEPLSSSSPAAVKPSDAGSFSSSKSDEPPRTRTRTKNVDETKEPVEKRRGGRTR